MGTKCSLLISKTKMARRTKRVVPSRRLKMVKRKMRTLVKVIPR